MTFEIESFVKVAAYIGGGIAMGFGAIGAAIGEGYTASQANAAISEKLKTTDLSFLMMKSDLLCLNSWQRESIHN